MFVLQYVDANIISFTLHVILHWRKNLQVTRHGILEKPSYILNPVAFEKQCAFHDSWVQFYSRPIITRSKHDQAVPLHRYVSCLLNSNQYRSFSSNHRDMLRTHSFIWVLPSSPLICLFERKWCDKICLNELLEDFRDSVLVSKMMRAPREDSYLVRKETEKSAGMFDLCRERTQLQSPLALQMKHIVIS